MTSDRKNLPAVVEAPQPKQTPLKIQRAEGTLNRVSAFPITAILQSYAERRMWDGETKKEEARNRYMRAREEGAQAMLEWRAAVENLNNLPQLVETVKNSVTAELVESKLRVKQANADLELFELKQEAKEAKLRAKIAKASLTKQQAEDALKPPAKTPEPSAKEQFETVKAEIQELQDALLKRMEETDGELSESEAKSFTTQEAILIRRMEMLAEKLNE